MKKSSDWPVRVVSDGPVAVGAALWRFRGELRLAAIVKATFDLVPGSAMKLAKPTAIRTADQHVDGHPMRGLAGAHETSPRLDQADIVVTGQAFAPGGNATKMEARLRLQRGSEDLIDKTLLVFGDRKTNGAKPASFKQLRLGYERALGGMGSDDNPFGVGLGGKGKPPNIVDPSDPRGRPGSFGPIPRSFPCRRKLLGGLSPKKLEGAIAEIPDDFDWSYFQCAPTDQRLPYVQGDEWIELTGMHPEDEVVRTQLPRAAPRLRLAGGEDLPDQLALRADMVHIDADRQQCSIVWRGSVIVPDEDTMEQLEIAGQLLLAGALVTRPGGSAAGLTAAPSQPLTDATSQKSLKATMALERESSGAGVGAPFQLPPAKGRKPTIVPDSVPGAPWAQEERGPAPSPADSSPHDSTRVLAPPDREPKASVDPPPTEEAEAASPWAHSATGAAEEPAAVVASPVVQVVAQANQLIDGSAPQPTATTAKATVEPRASVSDQAISLLWFDPERAAKLHAQRRWIELLDALEDEPEDDELWSALDLDPEQREAAGEAWAVLTRAPRDDPSHLRQALWSGIRDDGKFVPPLLLLSGTLALPFDEKARLESTIAVASTHAQGESELEQTIEAVTSFLDAPVLPTRLAEQLTERVAKAFAQAEPSLAEATLETLETLVTRALLEQRRYRVRQVLGGPHLLGHFRPSQPADPNEPALPAYLPAPLTDQLPLFQQFDVRLVAELHERQDPEQDHPYALRIAALARTAPLSSASQAAASSRA